MKKIIAVTGCPTGIAHTFMAEEALKTAAKKLNVEIKVETNGASGVVRDSPRQRIQTRNMSENRSADRFTNI